MTYKNSEIIIGEGYGLRLNGNGRIKPNKDAGILTSPNYGVGVGQFSDGVQYLMAGRRRHEALPGPTHAIAKSVMYLNALREPSSFNMLDLPCIGEFDSLLFASYIPVTNKINVFSLLRKDEGHDQLALFSIIRNKPDSDGYTKFHTRELFCPESYGYKGMVNSFYLPEGTIALALASVHAPVSLEITHLPIPLGFIERIKSGFGIEVPRTPNPKGYSIGEALKRCDRVKVCSIMLTK